MGALGGTISYSGRQFCAELEAQLSTLTSISGVILLFPAKPKRDVLADDPGDAQRKNASTC